MLSGCGEESQNFSVGVSLGGTGTGTVSTPRPDIIPNPTEDDVLYALAYPDPVTQYCNGMERTIQFVRHYAPFTPMMQGDRMDLLSINHSLKVRYKLQVIVKNTTSSKMYEYIDSCNSAFQLTGTQTEKNTKTNECLNDETVNEYQPNETRTYYYTFNLPNILQNWTASYHSQYSSQLYASSYEEDNLANRSQCSPLTSILLIDAYPSSMDSAPKTNTEDNSENESNSVDESSQQTASDPLPQFGAFGLDDGL
ncbi:hypothetical protein IAE19_04590 [Acinetobacter sp. S40]|uniref:hypothetical protein n=1 Tax=unclassified Acinetobacter TaxID=196816 RepID=UPI00190C8C9C|nr:MULTISPECIES: hypothetical protein [unclassified Acinetobacter]MBJ9984719.1 hypothetical protein [Acinetobacter sp. S40]MBK0062484.1 hypothetical protein [Acinetobacter sp. S55]MBK0066288.1 hypothetical protein [Acinetobacter sp. S54]